ncbi:MAG: hypothetical protein DRP91_09750 [Candidatus Neomarinimicrobiota bacterium]|nr:PorV/PorQ family protein [Candidatus Neomarinimicrobiota bacterium]RKY45615.1 MAG: hypothetical protein DRP91_09750 [Candidatus Neomarinimicrobiota bacterium]RKY54230.1 MAG: hypothetical protein DRP92_01675 [Candidatus Neomarinimicrobiota bacterium]
MSGMKRIVIITLFLITMPLSSYAQKTLFPLLGGQRAGTSVFTFLKIGIGARVGAMGNSGVSLASDATCLYWNPASAAQVGSNNIAFSHTQWPTDISYSYVGYIHKMSVYDFVGVSFGALYTDPMEITTEYQPYGTGEYFNYGDVFLGLTYSRKMTNRFSFGVTIKYVEEVLADLSMNNVLMDLGTFYWTGFKTLRFCVSLVNFGPQSRPSGTYLKPLKEGGYTESKYTLFSPPTEFRIGAAMDIYQNGRNKLLLTAQLNHPVDNAENFVSGVEYSIGNVLFLRGGWVVNLAERRYTTGCGVRLPIDRFLLRADVSYADFGVLGNIIQLQMSLGGK